MSVLFQTVINTGKLYSYRNLKKTLSSCSCVFVRKISDAPRKFITFDEVVAARRAEARRSLVVQVNSEGSFGELHSYCSKYADVKGIHHYKNLSGEHFMLIEFTTEENLKDVLRSCSSHQKDVEVMSLQSPFLWFRAAPGNKNKQLESCSESLVTKDGSSFPSEDTLFEELMGAETVSDQIQLLYDRTMLNDLGVRLRYLVARELEMIMGSLYANVEVQLFGSSVNGFGRMGCDLDLVLCNVLTNEMTDPSKRLVFQDKRTDGRAQRHLELCAEVMELRVPGARRVTRILHARVPIVKCAHALADVDCDLCCTNTSGVYMSELLHLVGGLDARARALVLCVRRWAAAAALTQQAPGRWITNFPLTLLVLFFLQQGGRPVLPSVNYLVSRAGEYMSGLLHLVGGLDARARALVLCVRRWAAAAALTQQAPGRWITNFPLTLLVLFFLQQGGRPVLPSVNYLVSRAGEYMSGLLHLVGGLDARARALVLCVRRWAAAAALTQQAPGRWITNFPLTLLVLFFLQQGGRPVLPSVNYLVSRAGEYMSGLLHLVGGLDARARALVLCVRRWAAAAALTQQAPGRWITNFPLTLLVLFFLQQGGRPVLPSVNYLVSRAGEYMSGLLHLVGGLDARARALVLCVRRWAAAAALTQQAPGRWITNFPLTLLVLFFLQQGGRPVLPSVNYLVSRAGEYMSGLLHLVGGLDARARALVLCVRRWAAAAALTQQAPGRWITNFPLTLLVLFFLQQGGRPVLPSVNYLVSRAGEYMSGLLHLVGGLDARARALVLCVRRWAAAAALTQQAPGRWITNFPLTLLVLFFLQQGGRPVLPSVNYLVSRAGEYMSGLLHLVGGLDARARALVLCVRRWAAAAALTQQAPGRWITNFPLTLLVLFFLQQGGRPVLPSVNYLVGRAGEYMSGLLHLVGGLDARARALVLCVRRWAAAAALTQQAPGRWITNFPLTLLVLFFLQQGGRPVLPSVNYLVSRAGEYMSGLLHLVGGLDARARALVLCVRRWAAAAALTQQAPGRWITNFPLTLLVLFFLQQGGRPVLPSVNYLVSRAGEYMSGLLHLVGGLDARARALVLCVRRWAAAAALTQQAPGRWITNFPLTLLVLFFLQQGGRPVLPSVNYLVSQAEKEDIRIAEDNLNCTFLRDANKLPPSTYSQNDASLETLLLQFFEFYAQFDFHEKAVSLNEGMAIRKPNALPLYIVNPLEQSMNVSRNVSYEECERLKMEVRNAAWQLEAALESGKTDDWGLLGLIEKKTTRGLKKLLRVGNSQRLVSVKDLFTNEEEPQSSIKNKLERLGKKSDRDSKDMSAKEVTVTTGDKKERIKFKNSQVASEVYRIRRDKII